MHQIRRLAVGVVLTSLLVVVATAGSGSAKSPTTTKPRPPATTKAPAPTTTKPKPPVTTKAPAPTTTKPRPPAPTTTKAPAPTTTICSIPGYPNATCVRPGPGDPIIGQPAPWYVESAGSGPCVNGSETLIEEKAVPTVVNLRPGTFTTRKGVVLTNYGGVQPRTDGYVESTVGTKDGRFDNGSGFVTVYTEAAAYKSVRTIKRCINGGFQHVYHGRVVTATARMEIYTYVLGVPAPTPSERFVDGACPRAGL